MKQVILNEKNAKQLGRTYVQDGVLKLILSASGCEFIFSGRKLQLTFGCDEDSLNDGKMCNLPRIAVFADGVCVLKKVIEKRSEPYTVFESDEEKSVKIRIVKLSEAAFSIAEVYPVELQEGESIAPTEEKQLKIEFIGDSITCGYGVDDANIESEFSTCAENSMKSYAYLTAEQLNADYSFFSASGYGIISGYTPDGKRNLQERIPPYYESYGFCYSKIDGGAHPHEIPWDFSRFTPDIAVINLGTNDHSFCGNDAGRIHEFEESYYDFIKTVRSHYPEAEIICALGIMETELFPSVCRACERIRKETGDAKLHTFEFARHDGRFGYSSKWHPSEDTHRISAAALVAYIEKLLK